jgi:hypothetical protein
MEKSRSRKAGKGKLDAHSDVDEHTLSIIEVEDLSKDLPRVELSVAYRGEDTRSALCLLLVTMKLGKTAHLQGSDLDTHIRCMRGNLTRKVSIFPCLLIHDVGKRGQG